MKAENLLLALVVLCSFSYKAQLVTYAEFSAASKPKKIKLTSYEAEKGQLFEIGDKITIGEPTRNNDTYQHIVDNELGTMKRIGMGNRGYEAEIKKFRIYGSKRTGFNVLAEAKSPLGLSNYRI